MFARLYYVPEITILDIEENHRIIDLRPTWATSEAASKNTKPIVQDKTKLVSVGMSKKRKMNVTGKHTQ